MDFKRIKKQIAKQTRSDIGFARLENTKGYDLLDYKKQAVSNAPIAQPKYSWMKLSYLFDRSQLNPDGGRYYNFCIVRDASVYSISCPEYTYGYHYGLFNVTGMGGMTRIKLDETEDGSLIDQQIANKFNALYAIRIDGHNKIQYLPMTIESNGANITIWSDVYNISNNTIIKEDTQLIYTSLDLTLNGKQTVYIPIGESHTDISIYNYVDVGDVALLSALSYDYAIKNNTISKAKAQQLKINRTELISSIKGDKINNTTGNFSNYTNKYIKVKLDLTNKIGAPPSSYNSLVYGKPNYDFTITSNGNGVTGEVVNKLSFGKLSDYQWESISVFRREYFDEMSLNFGLDNRNLYNTFLCSTSDSSIFYSGSEINIDGNDHIIKNVFASNANKINNGSFCYYTLGTPTGWSYSCTSSGSITPSDYRNEQYQGDYLSDGACNKMVSTVTAATKSLYIETDYIRTIEDKDYVNFWYKLDSGSPIGAFKILYYESSNGTVFSSASIGVDVSSACCSLNYGNIGIVSTTNSFYNNKWQQFQFQFDSSISFVVDTAYQRVPFNNDITCFKFRFYGSYQSTSYSKYLLDAVHIGSKDYNFIFSTSSSDRVAIQLEGFYEKATNVFTRFNTYFEDTTFGTGICNIYADSVFGQPKFVDNNDWPYWSLYGSGLLLLDSARNYIREGDFGGGGRHWSSSNGFYYSWITNSASGIFNNNFARFTGADTSGAVFIEQEATAGGLADFDDLNLSIWAKAEFPFDIKMKLSDINGNVSSATHVVDYTWQKYSVKVDTTYGFSGDTVYARVEVPTSCPYWVLDIGGVQLENVQDVSGFNFLDTATPCYSNWQGIVYSSPTGKVISSDFGTIKMWYTPIVSCTDYRKNDYSNSYLGFAYWGDLDNYKSIYFDLFDQRFVFRQYCNSVYTQVYVSSSIGFSAGAPIHLVGTWNDKGINLYVNNLKSTSSVVNISTTSGTRLYISRNSPNTSSSYSVNGIISCLRIDDCTWNNTDVGNDYYSQYKLYSSVPAITYSDRFVANKKISGQEDSIEVIDNKDLLPSSRYYYSYALNDFYGNQTLLSSSQSIVNQRISYEDNCFNLIPNSGFEVSDVDSELLYWDTTFAHLLFTSDRFFGTRCLRAQYISPTYVCTSYSTYISLESTASTYTLSWWIRNGAEHRQKLSIDLYNKRWEKITSLLCTCETSTFLESSYGIMETLWRRYATSFSRDTLGYSYSSAMTYCKLGLGVTSGITYYDALQLEVNGLNSIYDYTEGYFVQKGNIGTDVIDGNHLSFNTLVGQHFRNGELIVNSPDVDANRIVLGTYSANAFYTILAPTYIRHHEADMSSGAGYSYTKHVEFGEASFSSSVAFGHRFLDWFGSPFTPHCIVSPTHIKTYDSASGSNHQYVKITTVCTAGGVTVNAYLGKMIDAGIFITENLSNNWAVVRDNGVHYYRNVLYSETEQSGSSHGD